MKYLILATEHILIQHSAKTKPKNSEWTIFRTPKRFTLTHIIETHLLKGCPRLEWYIRVGHLDYISPKGKNLSPKGKKLKG